MNFDDISPYARTSQNQTSCELVPNGTVPAPGLRRVLQDGEVFTKGTLVKGDHVHALPYSYSKTVVGCPSWEFEYKWRGGTNTCLAKGYKYKGAYKGDGRSLTGFGALPTSKLPVETREFVDSISILKAQASLRKALVNTPLLLAEAAATVQTLKRYSVFTMENVITMQRRDVTKWLDAVKRLKGKPEQLKRVAKDIASRHLEFVFGVLPLISEMEGLAELLTEDISLTRTGRGRHTAVIPQVSKKTVIRGSQVSEEIETRYSVRTGLVCDIDVVMLNDASKLGFNALASFYDLTPLSFITGWFSNFDLWIRSLDPIPALTYRTGYSTRRTETTAQKVASPGSDSSYDALGHGASFISVLSQNRVVHAAMPDIQDLRFMDRSSLFAAFAGLSLAVQRLVKDAQREFKVKEFRYRGPRPKFLPKIRYRKG